MTGDSWMAGVEPVERPVTAARSGYDRVAAVYDLAEDPFERRARRQALALLAIRPGEWVLEIGPGTGHALVALASAAGPAGEVIGVDLSGRMLGRAGRRAARAGCRDRVWLAQGDAHRLPLAAGAVDAVFMSFVLELIGTAQIPVVLSDCRRVLTAGGRARPSLPAAHPAARTGQPSLPRRPPSPARPAGLPAHPCSRAPGGLRLARTSGPAALGRRNAGHRRGRHPPAQLASPARRRGRTDITCRRPRRPS